MMNRFLPWFVTLGLGVTVLSCTRERSIKPAPVLQPVHPVGVQQSSALPPEIPDMPKSITAQEFAQKQMVSFQLGNVTFAVMKLMSSVVDGLSFYAEHGTIAASYPAIINQTFTNFSVNLTQSFLPYAFHSIVDIADRAHPIVAVLLDATNGTKSYVAGFAIDTREFEARLQQGSFGKFAKATWGGWILPQNENTKVYFAVEENYLFLATEPGLLVPGAAYLRGRFATANPQKPVVVTLHNVATYASYYAEQVVRKMKLSESKRTQLLQFALPELSGLAELSVQIGLNSDLTLQTEVAAVPLSQGTGPFTSQLLTPADVNDLVRVLPASTVAFSIDKLTVPFISKLYKDMRTKFQPEIQHSPQSDTSILLGHFNSVLEWLDHMYDQSADSQVFFLSLYKKRLHAGAVLQLRSGINGCVILTKLEKLFRSLNPRTFLSTLSPEGKKELAWLVKILNIRTQMTTLDKRPALVVKLALQWDQMPRAFQSEQTIVAKYFLGKSQEIAFVLDNDVLWVMAGAQWNDLLKESSARQGKNIHPRMGTAGVLAATAWDMRSLMMYIIAEWLQIRLLSPMDSETIHQLKAALAVFEKFGYGWMLVTAGRLDENRIGVRFSIERETWPVLFAWFWFIKAW